MRILVLSSHTPSLFWFRLDMMKEMVDQGHTVFAIGNESPLNWSAKFAEHGINYRGIRVARNGINPINDIRTFFDLIKVISETRPDRIFAYHAKTVIYGSLASFFLGRRDFYALISGLGSIYIDQDFKSRIIRMMMKFEYRIACSLSRKVFFHNHDDRDAFVKDRLVTHQKTVIVNGSGVNLDEFVNTPFPKETAFLFIGRLIKDKGVIEYLNACKKIKEMYPWVRCLLVGPFDSNPSSITHADLIPYLANIEYFGEQNDVRPFIAQSSVFVLPSYREGTPKTILEAMAMGRPIITTDVPGCKETVIDGENGFLVKVQDEKDLFEKMKRFIENPRLIEKMGIKSLEIADLKYDVRKVDHEVFNQMNLV
jgi:glycosyltransferase involved in cell wall biosynthesis